MYLRNRSYPICRNEFFQLAMSRLKLDKCKGGFKRSETVRLTKVNQYSLGVRTRATQSI